MRSSPRHKLPVSLFGAFRGLAMAMALVAVAVGSLTPTAAATAATSADAGSVKPHKVKKKKAVRRKIAYGSAESTTERERRLYRECQGRPNAGACAGYAR